MKKKEFLKQINEGFERGAKTKLAKMLKIDSSNVTEWFNGRSKPSEQNVQKMAGLFSIPEQELWDMFNSTEEDIPQDVIGSGNVAGGRSAMNVQAPVQLALMAKDIELLKKEIEIIKLKLERH